MPVALVARGSGVVELAASVHEDVLALRADVTDSAGLRAALDKAVAANGVPDVLVYNAAIIQADAPGELSTEQHLRAWSVNVLGAMDAASHLGPAMAERGSGTILLTGGMPQPVAGYTSLSLGKAGLRALNSMLDETYGQRGVHVAMITVAGPIAPGTAFDPDLIAERYWTLHRQPRDQWELEVVHTASALV
jgi:NAD(P)-dependent dehydrogenase (short-subunit alcohol dehydrogenase family)